MQMNRSVSTETISAGQVMYVPSFQFTLSMSKSIIEEFMHIIMATLNVTVSGYKKLEDEYWGKIEISKPKREVSFTISFVKIKEKETRGIISVFNATRSDSKKIAETIFSKMKGVETTKSFYRPCAIES